MSHAIKAPKKLIEVALPLDDINTASVREGFIYKGNPSALHKWWAQRPLAAARAVIFAQLVNDPASLWEHQNPGCTPSPQQKSAFTRRRRELFNLLRELVVWENLNNEELFARAHDEIKRSWNEVCKLNEEHPNYASLFNERQLPLLHDPFAGGGTIPIEAQRLGLPTLATDLNPVAVIINKAMIEIPPRFSGRPPIHPSTRHTVKLRSWKGSEGLSEDIRHYGAWLRDEAERRIGHLYPPVLVTHDMTVERPELRQFIGKTLPVLGWLWARTVRSPNPAFSSVEVPLASTFILSSRVGRDAWVEPVKSNSSYQFVVRGGPPPADARHGTKLAKRSFKCVMSGSAIAVDYIKAEAIAGRMRERMMAIVVETSKGRFYLSPSPEAEHLAASASPTWRPDLKFAHNSRHMTPWAYGLDNFGLLATSRQMTALSCFSDLLNELRDHVDKVKSDSPELCDAGPDRGLSSGGSGAAAYSQAIKVYLAFALSKVSDYNCSLVPWYTKEDRPGHLFSKQALPMVWDFVEVNPLSGIGGSFQSAVDIVADGLLGCPSGRVVEGHAEQADAVTIPMLPLRFFSTDPPYYDNVPYADISDYFYVWLRRGVRDVYPDLFSTMATPKQRELVADSFRQGGKDEAEKFFLEGMTDAMQHMAAAAHPSAPVTIYYAFKQSETNSADATSSTGWVTFLEAVQRAGFMITGTWPMRTERASRSRGIDSNALASSVILVCRRRPFDAPTISRRQFLRELNTVLPLALYEMTQGSGEDRSPVAPVDLSQAIIGPGMAIFSKYSTVLEADGSPMTVRTALQLINSFLAEDDFDADTQFCLRWFEQHEWVKGPFGEADVLARAKATSVSGLDEAGVLKSDRGDVRLLRWSEYPDGWDPKTDKRLPIWEILHRLIREHRQNGDEGAGRLLAIVQSKAEATRQLAYRLYTLCERRGLAEEARAYNEIVTSWSGMESAAMTAATTAAEEKRQQDLFGGSS